MIITDEELKNIPLTGDKKIIYPGMVVYVCEPFSEEKCSKATIHCVKRESGLFCCVLVENMYRNNYDMMVEGDTEPTDSVYADYNECLKRVELIEQASDQ